MGIKAYYPGDVVELPHNVYIMYLYVPDLPAFLFELPLLSAQAQAH
jgi:hypothetical protein